MGNKVWGIFVIASFCGLTAIILNLTDMSGIITSFAINIFAGMILFLLIDYSIEKRLRQEERNRTVCILKVLVPSLERFYGLFIAIYAGTRETDVEENSTIWENIFTHKTNLYQDILKYIDLRKKSPFFDQNSFDAQKFFSKQSSFVKYLTWEEAFDYNYQALFKDLCYFQQYYSAFLPSKVLKAVTELSNELNSYFMEKKVLQQAGFNNLTWKNPESETLYRFLRIERIIELFEVVMVEISKEYGENLLKVTVEQINLRSVRPLLGELRQS